jgi:hypothetical protein
VTLKVDFLRGSRMSTQCLPYISANSSVAYRVLKLVLQIRQLTYRVERRATHECFWNAPFPAWLSSSSSLLSLQVLEGP